MTGGKLRWSVVVPAVALVVALASGSAMAEEGEVGGIGGIFWAGINEAKIGWLIILASVISLALIVEHFLTIRRAVLIPPDLPALFDQWIKERQYTDMMQYLETDKSMLGQTVAAALARSRSGFDAMKEAAETMAGEQIGRMFRKIEWLNIIGGLGPLLGLMGTVIGMIMSFSEIAAAKGAAKPEQLAVGISIALVNTFLGLFVAAPSLIAYGHFRAQVDTLGNETAMLAMDILENFRPGNKSGSSNAKPGAPEAPSRVQPRPVGAK
jgi:biopolymer transport protein ExbB